MLLVLLGLPELVLEVLLLASPPELLLALLELPELGVEPPSFPLS